MVERYGGRSTSPALQEEDGARARNGLQVLGEVDETWSDHGHLVARIKISDVLEHVVIVPGIEKKGPLRTPYPQLGDLTESRHDKMSPSQQHSPFANDAYSRSR